MTGPLNTPIGSTSAFSRQGTSVTFIHKFQARRRGRNMFRCRVSDRLTADDELSSTSRIVFFRVCRLCKWLVDP